jgi:hypothetical protein
MTDGFTVLAIEHDRTLTLGWLMPDGTPQVTWTFLLDEVTPGVTRLLVRVRGGTWLPVPWVAVAADHGRRPGRSLRDAAETTAWHQAPRRVDAGGPACHSGVLLAEYPLKVRTIPIARRTISVA